MTFIISTHAGGTPTDCAVIDRRFKLEQADHAFRLFDIQTTGKGVFVS